jgi:hypothetical protein
MFLCPELRRCVSIDECQRMIWFSISGPGERAGEYFMVETESVFKGMFSVWNSNMLGKDQQPNSTG